MSDQKDILGSIIVTTVVIGLFLFGLYAIFFMGKPGYVDIKYRDDPVDVSSSSFEALENTDKTVKGAWYDSEEGYLVINLSGTYYHYCEMPSGEWNEFKLASEPYTYYENNLRGEYDCRVNRVPEY